MRAKFAEFLKDLSVSRGDIIALLGDISVGNFLIGQARDRLPDWVLNLGIAEQSMISFAAGLSRAGLLPFVHSISAFLIERTYEQIKCELSYNKTKCILVSANGPYDYTRLGPTHHCANDVPLIDLLPNMTSVLPGRDSDVRPALNYAIESKSSCYVRLTSLKSSNNYLTAGKIHCHRQFANAPMKRVLWLFVGESISVLDAISEPFSADVLYVWSFEQVDFGSLDAYEEIHVWEPYASGLLASRIVAARVGRQRITSYTYPRSIEDGIFSSPPYFSAVYE